MRNKTAKRSLAALICLLVASLCLCALSACGGGQHRHTMTRVEEVPATCTEPGTAAHWTCSECGKNFADEAGTTEITDLTLEALGHDFSSEITTPATCEEDGGYLYQNASGMENCFASGKVTVSAAKNYVYAGGLVGESRKTVTECYATGDILITDSLEQVNAGGLIGRYQPSYGTTENSYATGNVTVSASKGSYAGGLSGYSSASLSNCYATGNVTVSASGSTNYVGGPTGNKAYAGGLLGNNTGDLSACYASGDVSAWSESGDAYAGGLIANNTGDLSACFAAGNVSAEGSGLFVGGLAGKSSGTLTKTYRAAEQTVTAPTNTLGTAQAVADLQSEAFLTGTLKWSASVWNFAEGQFPTLK